MIRRSRNNDLVEGGGGSHYSLKKIDRGKYFIDHLGGHYCLTEVSI